MLLPSLFVGPSREKGRGVFTSEKISKGVVIEESPVIVMTAEERKLLDQTRLHDYIFEWGNDRQQCCVALGLLSMYNHSSASNCEYQMDYLNALIRVITMREINAREELFINYNGDWDDSSAVWFETK